MRSHSARGQKSAWNCFHAADVKVSASWLLPEALTGSASGAFHSIQLPPVVLVLWPAPVFKTHLRGLCSRHRISCVLVSSQVSFCLPLLWTVMLTSRNNPGHSPHLKILHLITPVGRPWPEKTLLGCGLRGAVLLPTAVCQRVMLVKGLKSGSPRHVQQGSCALKTSKEDRSLAWLA